MKIFNAVKVSFCATAILVSYVGHAVADSSMVDCDTAEPVLISHPWENPETGSIITFTKTSTYEGRYEVRVKSGVLYSQTYELDNRHLTSPRDSNFSQWVCKIIINLRSGNCKGDVSGYYIQKIGQSVRFRSSYTKGDLLWEPESINARCEGSSSFNLVPQ